MVIIEKNNTIFSKPLEDVLQIDNIDYFSINVDSSINPIVAAFMNNAVIDDTLYILAPIKHTTILWKIRPQNVYQFLPQYFRFGNDDNTLSNSLPPLTITPLVKLFTIKFPTPIIISNHGDMGNIILGFVAVSEDIMTHFISGL